MYVMDELMGRNQFKKDFKGVPLSYRAEEFMQVGERERERERRSDHVRNGRAHGKKSI